MLHIGYRLRNEFICVRGYVNCHFGLSATDKGLAECVFDNEDTGDEPLRCSRCGKTLDGARAGSELCTA